MRCVCSCRNSIKVSTPLSPICTTAAWTKTSPSCCGASSDVLRAFRGDGRDHWPEAGAAVIAGGGFKMGQVIGETDSHGGQSLGQPYTPSNVLANLYQHLGIDPAITIPDHNNRPMHVLDDRRLVQELIA